MTPPATAVMTAESRLFEAALGKQPSELDLVKITEHGLPTRSIDVLREEGLTFSEVHSVVLPARTLKHRQHKQQPLSLEESDRALRVAKILTVADRVFDNHDKALRWLRRANPRLDGRTPLELLKSEVGGDLVYQMLIQIDEGMFV